MKRSLSFFLRGTGWTISANAGGLAFRVASNVVLTRLLAPELFGVIAIVHSARIGIELLSDIGIVQNMVYDKRSDQPAFYNTVWSLQIIRGFFLWVVSLAAAVPLSYFYKNPILAYILPIGSLPFIFAGWTSMGLYLAQKRMQFVRLNVLSLITDFIVALVNIVVALVSPTILALVSGLVIGGAARTLGSYFLVNGIRHKFYISNELATHMFHFSKWIFFSSVILFLSMNFDTLYLGKAGTFALLGVYGVARTLSQQIVTLVSRLNAMFVFPLISASNEAPRAELRKQIEPIRRIFLLAVAAGLSLIAVGGDLLVSVLYDQRYQAAGWMLPILMIGAWFSVLCSVNESILLGLGKPSYSAIANCIKFSWLVIAAPLGFEKYGAIAIVIVVAVSDLWRYFPVLFGQAREHCSFANQDLIITVAAFGMVLLWEWLRWTIGLGVSPV